MNNLSWVEVVVSILSGLTVCIPLVVKLVQTVKAAVQEKNWTQIVAIVLDLMQQAEGLFAEGAARKAWVMAGVQSAAKSANFPYDDVAAQKVSDMIDAICAAAKVVNVNENAEDAKD